MKMIKRLCLIFMFILIMLHHFTSFFHKKVSYRIFLVYNEFAKTNTKESDPVR